MSDKADRTLTWPDGSIYRITRSSADTGGELLEMEWELPANGWAPQPHVHPRLTEEYEVLDGSLDVLLGSEWRTLTAGEAASVPPGMAIRSGSEPFPSASVTCTVRHLTSSPISSACAVRRTSGASAT